MSGNFLVLQTVVSETPRSTHFLQFKKCFCIHFIVQWHLFTVCNSFVIYENNFALESNSESTKWDLHNVFLVIFYRQCLYFTTV